MSKSLNNHDGLFRRVLGEPVNAASQLRAVLPKALTGSLDLDRLTPVPGTFIDEAFRSRHTDLLFTVPLCGRDALIYVLVEHQSSEDPLMAFRMLRYITRIWDQYLRAHPDAARLPVVIPLVVHHNRRMRPWAGSPEVLDLLDIDPQVADTVRGYLPRFRFILDDLTTVDEQALRARPVTPLVRVTLLLLKIATGNSHLADDLHPWAGDLRQVLDQAGVEQFAALLSYINSVGETPADELEKLVASLGPEAEEAYMTTAEVLRKEGEARGEARGKALGKAEGKAEALVQLLTLKFGPLPQTALSMIHAAPITQLEEWTARFIIADTLDDVLR